MSDLTELAARLAADPEWRWMPGMAWRRNAPGAQSLSSMQGRCASQMDCDQMPSSMIPDLTDPATVGCLLERLPPGWTVDRSNGDFRVTIHGMMPANDSADYASRDDNGRPWFYVCGPTLGEAVARALLAVWGAR